MASVLDPQDLERARNLLLRPAQFERVWPVVLAAAACAAASLLFATAMVMAPPLVTERIAPHDRAP